MNRIALVLALATATVAAQTTPTPAPKSATTKSATTKSATTKPATSAAKAGSAPAAGAKKPVTTTASSSAIKLPPGVPAVKGVLKTGFALKYQDVTIGTGKDAEPNKLYKVHYTGWLAADGKKFDSSFDHKSPVLDKDGKPENDADGKPKMGEAQPIQFPQGRGRVIPGWDQGFEGMKVGGKRRLFIPYQLAYGAVGRPPVIPAKADLIFDIELVDVADMPAPPVGGPMGRPMPGAMGAPGAPKPPTSAAPAAPATPSAPARTPTPAAAPAPAAPATPPPAPAKPNGAN